MAGDARVAPASCVGSDGSTESRPTGKGPRPVESRLERVHAAADSLPMQLSELLPALHQLPRADKFRAVQFLTTELAQDEGGLVSGAEYPVWSPYEAHEAAATLTQYLREQTGPQ